MNLLIRIFPKTKIMGVVTEVDSYFLTYEGEYLLVTVNDHNPPEGGEISPSFYFMGRIYEIAVGQEVEIRAYPMNLFPKNFGRGISYREGKSIKAVNQTP